MALESTRRRPSSNVTPTEGSGFAAQCPRKRRERASESFGSVVHLTPLEAFRTTSGGKFMRGYTDLHCHYIAGVDDGVRSEDDGVALLRALHAVGFDHVVATPHMRPAMFDNHAAPLREAYAQLRLRLDREADLPETSLAAEHFFDDVVFERLLRGQGLPYTAGRSVLIELATEQMPVALPARLFDLRMKRLRPVIAHPERYTVFHRDPTKQADALRKAGAVLLLDVCALVGKYGERALRAAEQLVENDGYYAACSDAHRIEDAEITGRAIDRLHALVGREAGEVLLRDRPKEILQGRIFDDRFE